MSQQPLTAIRLADQIVTKAESVLAPLDRQMALMKWPGEIEAIMWESVAQAAMNRAAAAAAKGTT